jgi:predicted hydrocarbon binding protein
MSDKEPIHVQLLQDELRDCKALSKSLKILAGEVSSMMDRMVKAEDAEEVFVSMGEDAGRRLGEKARDQFGVIENVEEALDTFIHRTNMWYGYEIEVDRIEDGTIYINILESFIRDILRDRKLSVHSSLCGITRGYLKGALKELTGKEVDIEVVVADVDGIFREKITVR